MSDYIVPRRCDLLRQTPIEAAIRAARDAVEAGPAHPHMTRATVLIGQALDAVADFVDGVPEQPQPPAGVGEADCKDLIRAVRAADEAHQKSGGGTNHYVRDCLLPALAAEGLSVVRAAKGGA